MHLEIKKSDFLGYIFIYCMLIANQSNILKAFFVDKLEILAVIFGAMLLIGSKRLSQWTFGFVGTLLFFVLFTRLNNGGAGISIFLTFIVPILATACAVTYNRDMFLSRFVKLVTFLAAVSIVGYVIGLMSPSLWESITYGYLNGVEDRFYYVGNNYESAFYYSHGLFLYSMAGNRYNQNMGIYTEPGVYQVVLNSAIFVLLFIPQFLVNWNNKEKNKSLAVCLIALITTQSTTGYIALAIMAFSIIISRNSDSAIRRRVINGVCILGLILCGDYMIRGNESFIFSSIIKKLFINTNGNTIFSLNAGTGRYRTTTILACITTMIKHPLGVGYDYLNTILTEYDVGAIILMSGAALGVGELLSVLFWVHYPVIKYTDNRLATGVFTLMYINTTLAQTNQFYPALICIPVFLCYYNWVCKGWRIKYIGET